MTMKHAHSTWPMRPISELLIQVRRPVDVVPDAIYHEIGIRSHCKGIFHKLETTGKQIGEKRVFWVEPGCLVLNIVFAWEQAVAMTSDAEVGMIASHRFPMYRSRNGKLLPEYTWRYFSTPRGKYDLNIASPGGAGRNKTLGQEVFNRLKIPVPPIEYQREVIEILSTTDRAISGMAKLIAAKRALKKGLAQQLLTGRRRLPGCGGEWADMSLRNLCSITYGQSQAAVATDNGPYPIYGTGGVVGYAELFLHSGPAIILGRKGSIDRPLLATGPFWVIDTAFYVLPKHDISVKWLYQKFLTVNWLLYNEASGVPSLSRETLFGIHIHVPPLDEQTRIAAVLGAADRELVLLEKKLAALRELKKGLMQKLLANAGKENA